MSSALDAATIMPMKLSGEPVVGAIVGSGVGSSSFVSQESTKRVPSPSPVYSSLIASQVYGYSPGVSSMVNDSDVVRTLIEAEPGYVCPSMVSFAPNNWMYTGVRDVPSTIPHAPSSMDTVDFPGSQVINVN